MNPSNSKIAAVSRRLTAFMAALVLLAALALPAYAEASGEQTTAALSLLAETTEDTNAPDALDAADTADAAAQGESLTPDTDDDTLQGDAAPAQDADPAQQDDNEATDQSEEAQPDPKAEAAAEEPQDETAAAQQENTEEAKQGEENLNDANEENAADDLQQDANAEDELLMEDADEEGRVAEYAGTLNVGDKFSIYFLAPMDWDESQKITVYGRLNNNADPNKESQYEWTATPTEKKVADGRTLYKIDAVLGKDKSSDTCPYGGYKFVQIQQGTNWVQLRGYAQGKNPEEYWVTAEQLADQCIDFAELTAQNANNILTDAVASQWLQPLSSLKIVHTAYAGKPMRFKNESGAALTNVTAVFYDKDDTSTSGELKVVLRQTLGDINAGKTSSVFYIPTESCAYVQFFSGNDKLGKCYNFYGEGLDEEETETPSFEYNSATACVFTYKGTEAENAWSAGTASTIYFDATFSKLSYVNTNTGDEAGYACSIPAADGNLYYCIKKTDGTIIVKNGTATKVGETDYWSVTVPDGASQIFFSAWPWDQKTTSPTTNTGSATDWLDIPTIYDEPCFVADTGDNSINTGNKTLRGGYWTEKGTPHDAETAKDTDVVDIAQKPFVSDSSTKYITSTLYDYYTDWELNGNNRDSYTDEFTEGQLSWVPFRQFDQAISNYYQKSKENIKYPIYTGHFQTDETVKTGKEEDKKKLFSKIADTLNLFGWASSGEQYKKFMAANNSELDITEGTGKYNYTFLGIAANNLDSNGNILMSGTSNLVMPHFNEDFLTGNNSKNAKLGEVYHNVSFPFTKAEVFADEPGVQYWWFDSSQTSLYLRQDPATDKLYLGNKGANGATANTTDANSMNVNAGSKNDSVSTTYGFFPFNETSTSLNANTYNYGYGTKLEIPFTLTSDGMVEAKGDNGETKKVPIRYYFSGDDDVWVYIDDQLVLDIGGAHGKVSGIIDFDQTGNNKDSVTAYVSRVKYNGDEAKQEYSENNKSTSPTNIKYKFNEGSEDKHVNDYYYSNIVSIPNLTTGTHTLTMYYMERGMWESNMAVAFNFPDHNELEVEKEVDLNDVNEIFKSSFQNRELFTFTIQNQATHYGLKEATGAGEVETADVDLTKATPTPATTTTDDGNIFRMDTDPADTGQKALHWFAQYTDTGSQYRAKRYGILTLNDAINISQMKYLTFKLYVKSESGQYTPAISNMYLELLDDKGKQKGGVDGATLSGTTYGTVTMKEDEWITVKLDLTKLNKNTDFDDQVKTIRFGCNYQRNIYLKDFTFTSAVPDAGMVGFTTQQADIPDYGSATSGKLKNATNARFTSTKEGAGTQVVDENGKFLLADGETITFTDQFRRGSYISLKEELNEKLFATSWTLYENGEPVTKMETGSKVTNPSQMPNLVDNTKTSGPDDGRTEVKNAAGEDAQNGNKYTGSKPNANTIVFRSYSTPDAESDAAFTKLKVKYTNKVKTGSLKIVKKAAEGEMLDGEYTFTVTFTNIGGLGLETEPITTTVTIKGTDEKTITGIPIGTRFRVEETGQTDGAHLQGVTITDCADDAAVIDNKQVHGTITEQDGAADVKIATVTFTNTKRELFDLQLTKQWKDADGNVLTANLPSQIYVQLQRKKDADTEWAAVNYPADNTKDYVTITPDDSGWNYLFSGLDRKEVNDTNDGARWTYRVVEGTLDESGNFTPLEDGKTILLEGNVYTVTGGEETTDEDGKAAITLTNTLQNPKFALDVTKRSADEEDGSKKLLAGVEFKLEKLNEDGSTVDENFKAKNGITNDNGELMLKGTDGKPTTNKAFADLEAGTYRLTETKTAEGYSLLSAPIKVVFGKDGTCTLDDVEVEVLSDANPTDFTKNSDGSYTLALTVLNRKTPLLPHTGADAPSLWLLIGLPLAVAGLLILVFRYNKKGGRRQ